jgi:ribosomal protein S12 methylthiotransferase
VVLVAQDLASYARDRSGQADGHHRRGAGQPIVDLVRAVAERVDRVRLLYLYPSALDDALVDAVLATGVPYFDLSLQHVSRPLLKRMRRWGDGDRFLRRIGAIRSADPTAAFRSSFIVGYPGETEEDHDLLLEWLTAAQLDWVGFFPFSCEAGTYAADLDGQVADGLVAERLRECGELQDAITAARRDALVGATVEVLVDAPGVGRTYREAPEIDGIVTVPDTIAAGTFVQALVTGAVGPDLVTELIGDDGSSTRSLRAGSGAAR